jgi:prepilin-type N-terminal cleavage/methylation domain-containing protein
MRVPRLVRAAGFTLVELLAAITILAITVLLGMPALENTIQRGKIEGLARQTSMLMYQARLAAIRYTVPTTVRVDFATDRIVAFRDPNRNGIQDDPESEPTIGGEHGFPLPLGVSFQAPGEVPEAANAVVEFDEDSGGGWVIFQTDGSVAKAGGFRLADRLDNYLEIRIAPPATARIYLRKWDGVAWREPGEGGAWSWN